MEDAIVLNPSPGGGHLISMVELGKLILKHHPSFSITILVLSEPNTILTPLHPNMWPALPPSTSPPSIPPPHLSPSTTSHLYLKSHPPSTSSFVELNYLIPRLNNPNLHQTLKTLSQTSKLKAFIIDFFCDTAFEVATTLDIPTWATYYFFNSNQWQFQEFCLRCSLGNINYTILFLFSL